FRSCDPTSLPGRHAAGKLAQLPPQQRHPRHGQRGVAALVALVAAGAGERLLHRVAGDHAEGAGDTGGELRVLDATGRLGADEVLVVGLAADADAEAGAAGEAGDLVLPFPFGASRARSSRERQLIGTWDRELADRRFGHTRDLEAFARPLQQPLGQVLVETADDNRELKTG